MTNVPTTDETAASASPALAYAERGWHVFPTNGKVPRTANGNKGASCDPEAVRRLPWHPEAGVAIRTGAPSGLVVVDLDGEPGADAWHELEQRHGVTPGTVEALTGNGRHLYFQHPGREIRNSAGKLGDGIDVRGDGGYVIAPPSPHPSGRRYSFEVSGDPAEVDVAELPVWLLELLTAERSNAAAGRGVAEGKRNATLTSLAGSMRRRGASAAAIAAALKAENDTYALPLPAEEVARIAASVSRYEPEEEPEEPFALEVMTARATCELPDPPSSDELLGPLLQRGTRLVLGGGTGEGKTTLSTAMVRAVVAGERFLDWTGAGGRALVIDAEQGLKTVKRRLREAGLEGSDAVDYVRVPDGLALDSDPRHIAEVERVLRAGDYSLVLADPLYKLSRGDSNAEREAVDLMRRFDSWRDELRFALLLPVHLRKPPPGAKFSLNEFFGSSAYLRGAEVVIGLQRVSDGYARLHFLKDRDGDLPVPAAWGLLFDQEQGYRRDPADGAREPTCADRVRGLLADSPFTAAQLAELTGNAERTIKKALAEVGAVGEGRPKVYSLTADELPEDLAWD